MNRPILYRIYNAAGNKMLYDIENVYECLMQQIAFNGHQPMRGFVPGYDHVRDGMIWMQWTTLHDAYEERIWEGDIIQDEHFTYEVRFGDFHMDGLDHIGFHTFCLNHKEEIGPLGRIDNGTCKVIGNIYTQTK